MDLRATQKPLKERYCTVLQTLVSPPRIETKLRGTYES